MVKLTAVKAPSLPLVACWRHGPEPGSVELWVVAADALQLLVSPFSWLKWRAPRVRVGPRRDSCLRRCSCWCWWGWLGRSVPCPNRGSGSWMSTVWVSSLSRWMLFSWVLALADRVFRRGEMSRGLLKWVVKVISVVQDVKTRRLVASDQRKQC